VAKIGCNVMGGWSNEERPIALANNQAQTENRRKHSFVVECWISQADPANGREEKNVRGWSPGQQDKWEGTRKERVDSIYRGARHAMAFDAIPSKELASCQVQF
jgi:hypothetical protein